MRSGIDNSSSGIGPVQAGLTAGAIAGVAGVLVNLPLESPSDSFFNSASVMAASLFAGLGVGVTGRFLGGGIPRRAPFWAFLVVLFGLTTVVAVMAESRLERSVSYMVPLAAIVLGLTAALFLLLLQQRRSLPWKITVVMLAIAIGLGIGLAGYGDQQSGRLELPPRASIQSMPGIHLWC